MPDAASQPAVFGTKCAKPLYAACDDTAARAITEVKQAGRRKGASRGGRGRRNVMASSLFCASAIAPSPSSSSIRSIPLSPLSIAPYCGVVGNPGMASLQLLHTLLPATLAHTASSTPNFPSTSRLRRDISHPMASRSVLCMRLVCLQPVQWQACKSRQWWVEGWFQNGCVKAF